MSPTLLALRHAPSILRRIVLAVPAERHDDRPVEGRFTLREVVCHVGDLERINRERVRRAIVEDVPAIENAEPDRLAAEGGYGERDVRAALDEFANERAATLAYLESLTEQDLARRLTKAGLGTVTVREFLVAVVGHDQYHLEQASESLGAESAFPAIRTPMR